MNETALPLRDIHLPAAISWWPPAPGWWGLLLLLLLAALLLQWWRQRRQRAALQRSALRELRVITATYRDTHNDAQLVTHLSLWLRRVSLSRFPRDEVAGLTGEDWLRWLDQQHDRDDFLQGAGRVLAEAPYRREVRVDATALLDLCERWVRQVTRPARGTP